MREWLLDETERAHVPELKSATARSTDAIQAKGNEVLEMAAAS